MDKIKIMIIIGTRPEATKMCPLIKEFEKRPGIELQVCVTAQHRELLDMVLNVFDVKPDYDLNIMQQGQSLSEITSRTLSKLESVIERSKPDLVLVHGDTTTTFTAALAAFYSGRRLGHVEAGLRTYDKYQPYPEEMNRKLTGALADLHFAPTMLSKVHLLKENINEENIFITGNTAVDCLQTTVRDDYSFTEPVLNSIDYRNQRVITMTAHRRENYGQPLINICRAVLQLVNDNPDTVLIDPVHYSRPVRDTVFEILGGHPRIHLLPPIEFNDLHNLMYRSYIVMTDSGGLQEEAPSLGKPVLVLRNTTERPEGIEAGALKLAGTEQATIYKLATELLTDARTYEKMAVAKNPFGDGNAARRIADAVLYTYGMLPERPADFHFTP